MTTWESAYRQAKSDENPHELSSSEHRNLTKKVAKLLFEEGQKNSPLDYSHAIKVAEEARDHFKPGSERHHGATRILLALKEAQEGLASRAA